MFNRSNHRRTGTVLVGLALASATVVGAAGIVDAATDANAASDATTVVALATPGDGADPADQAEREERREARRQDRQEDHAEVAALLGLDVADVGEQLRRGSTLADVAVAQGVEVSVVVDLIVEQKTERLDAAVADGRITQDEADEKAADLVERVQTRVEEGRPERGTRGQRNPGADHGPRGDRGQGAEVAPADDEG